ncbi:hypothetical protein [Ruegeria marina]|uniref:hypothetical protein n=1 Tax=Ruegeria marina TaxID=639004 RepID=UPI00115F7D16|nr:hypothetical protein [Ruegeria marina]
MVFDELDRLLHPGVGLVIAERTHHERIGRGLVTNNLFNTSQQETSEQRVGYFLTGPLQGFAPLHPWLPASHFLNDSKASFRTIVEVLDRYGFHFVNAAQFSDTKWTTICNALRTKNDYDTRFYAAWHTPIQEAFVLEERRPGRSVISIDFNAMYPACMQESFPDPSALRHVYYGRDLSPHETLPIGLYRCVLNGPASELIARHNPSSGNNTWPQEKLLEKASMKRQTAIQPEHQLQRRRLSNVL